MVSFVIWMRWPLPKHLECHRCGRSLFWRQKFWSFYWKHIRSNHSIQCVIDTNCGEKFIERLNVHSNVCIQSHFHVFVCVCVCLISFTHSIMLKRERTWLYFVESSEVNNNRMFNHNQKRIYKLQDIIKVFSEVRYLKH